MDLDSFLSFALVGMAALMGLFLGMSAELFCRVRHLERDITATHAQFGYQTKVLFDLTGQVQRLKQQFDTQLGSAGRPKTGESPMKLVFRQQDIRR